MNPLEVATTQPDSNQPDSNTTTVLFLGSGAGDWPKSVPAEEETASGNRNYRRFSALLVNQQILIDFGPTLISALQTFEVDSHLLTDILLTHSHWDHLDVPALCWLAANRGSSAPLRLWGHPLALARIPWV